MSHMNKRTTADDVLNSLGLDLSGKVFLITGGSSGLGKASARALATKGARVILTARNVQSAEAAVLETREHAKKFGRDALVEVISLDLGSVASIKACVAQIRDLKLSCLDAIICNAGVFGLPRGALPDTGLESTFGCNHFGHFALVKLLLPLVLRSSMPRVVVVSSDGHRGTDFKMDLIKDVYPTSYTAFGAYGQSKLANVLFTKELQRLHGGGDKLDAFALHPGSLINTGIARESSFLSAMLGLISFWTKSVEQGAATQVRAAVDPALSGKGGAYLSDCQVVDASPQSCEEAPAKALWDWSEEIFAQHFQGIEPVC